MRNGDDYDDDDNDDSCRSIDSNNVLSHLEHLTTRPKILEAKSARERENKVEDQKLK